MDGLFTGSVLGPLLCVTCDMLREKMPSFKKKKGKIAAEVQEL